ncbi:MAG: RHS repeat-associated core domain-containing protein [Phycisphaerales bacterium JB065]
MPPYGTFTAYPAGDVNADGTVNSADTTAILIASGYKADLDVNMDGSVDSLDSSMVSGLTGRTLSSGQLSDRGNIVGWCGYLYEEATGMWLARHRWQIPELGRWANRDPIGYAGGSQNLYEYVNGNPVFFNDPHGLRTDPFELYLGKELNDALANGNSDGQLFGLTRHESSQELASDIMDGVEAVEDAVDFAIDVFNYSECFVTCMAEIGNVPSDVAEDILNYLVDQGLDVVGNPIGAEFDFDNPDDKLQFESRHWDLLLQDPLREFIDPAHLSEGERGKMRSRGNFASYFNVTPSTSKRALGLLKKVKVIGVGFAIKDLAVEIGAETAMRCQRRCDREAEDASGNYSCISTQLD